MTEYVKQLAATTFFLMRILMLHCLCVSGYWLYSLVWLAVLLSGRDCEDICGEKFFWTLPC